VIVGRTFLPKKLLKTTNYHVSVGLIPSGEHAKHASLEFKNGIAMEWRMSHNTYINGNNGIVKIQNSTTILTLPLPIKTPQTYVSIVLNGPPRNHNIIQITKT